MTYESTENIIHTHPEQVLFPALRPGGLQAPAPVTWILISPRLMTLPANQKKKKHPSVLMCACHLVSHAGLIHKIVRKKWGIWQNTNPKVPHHLDSQREGFQGAACQKSSGLPFLFLFLFSQLHQGAVALRRRGELSCSLVHSSVGAFPNLIPNNVILQFVSGREWLEWALESFLTKHRLQIGRNIYFNIQKGSSRITDSVRGYTVFTLWIKAPKTDLFDCQKHHLLQA